jgi:hypothetical protein
MKSSVMGHGLICFPIEIDKFENASAYVYSVAVHHELLYRLKHCY